MPLSGEQVRRRRAHKALERGGTSPEGGDRPSSEGEPHSRGRPAFERGGTLLEGAPSPRVRRNLTRGGATSPRVRRNLVRGGAQPPSEAEVCPCSAAPLERSRVLLEGGWAVCLVGRWGHQGRGPSRWAVSFVLNVFWVRLHFVFLRKKVGFPWLFRGPLWLSPTVAPEHLWVYPLGSHR
jgi:hypothetical protein